MTGINKVPIGNGNVVGKIPTSARMYLYIQGDTDQLYMAVYFWYLVTRDFSSVRHNTAQHGHIYLVGLYVSLYEMLSYFIYP